MPHIPKLDEEIRLNQNLENEINKIHQNPQIKYSKTKHIEQWNWLSNNTDKEIYDWPEWDQWDYKSILRANPKKRIPYFWLYPCEYAYMNFGFLLKDYYRLGYCYLCCPLIWPNGYACFDSGHNGKNIEAGLVYKYDQAKYQGNLNKRSEYALQIANLSVKHII